MCRQHIAGVSSRQRNPPRATTGGFRPFGALGCAALVGWTSTSPRRRSANRRRRQREEARWARKSGPVTVRHVDPSSLRDAEGRTVLPAPPVLRS